MTQSIPFYTEERFCPAQDEAVFYGFFGRKGGVSTPPCEGLNCGLGSKDDPQAVMRNRARVAAQAGVEAEALLSVYQVHGAEVAVVDNIWPSDERPKADAMVTDKPGYALGILTADCAPVLFIGKKEDGSPVIGATHAGWKGALSGVLEATVSSMVSCGAQIETVRACIGPCIGRNAYEVDIGFAEKVLAHNDAAEHFFSSASREGHLMFDLSGYCAWRLSGVGVKTVSLLDIDTYSRDDEFYSYRRATHQKADDYGRQISVIAIR